MLMMLNQVPLGGCKHGMPRGQGAVAHLSEAVVMVNVDDWVTNQPSHSHSPSEAALGCTAHGVCVCVCWWQVERWCNNCGM